LCPLPPTPALYPLSLHDALPISRCAGTGARFHPGARGRWPSGGGPCRLSSCVSSGPYVASVESLFHVEPIPNTAHGLQPDRIRRSEEHTSELQSRENLVCRLLLE